MEKITNPNFLNPQGFIVMINRLPGLSYFCNTVTLPGINASNPTQANPFSKLPVPADRADFESLTFQFNVSEDITNWVEIMRWMIGFTFPEDFDQFEFSVLDDTGNNPGTLENHYSDIIVIVLDSDRKAIAEFVYMNCIPTSLSGIDMTVNDSDVNVIPCTATFDFSHFRICKPGTNVALDILDGLV